MQSSTASTQPPSSSPEQGTWTPILNLDNSPLPPPLEILERNPKFANLVKRIDYHHKLLVLNHLQPRCVAAKKKCDENRLIYLKYLTLKQELNSQTLLNEMKTEKVFCSAFSELNQLAPIGLSPVSMPNQSESPQTIYGLEKKSLLNGPDTGKEDIIKQVEASLNRRVGELNEFISESTKDVRTSPLEASILRRDTEDWLVESQRLHDSLLSLQSDYFLRLSQLIESTEANFTLTLRVLQDQTEVVGPYANACSRYYTAIATSLHLKFKVLKYQLLESTYSPSRVHALHTIQAQLEADAAKSRQEIETCQLTLAQYKAAGPEFEKLAEAYHAMLAKIDVLRRDIERLKA